METYQVTKISFKFGNLPLIGPSNVAINVRNSFGFITLAGRLFTGSSAASSSLSRVTTTAIVIISANKNTALHTIEMPKKKPKRDKQHNINSNSATMHNKLAELFTHKNEVHMQNCNRLKRLDLVREKRPGTA